MNGTVNAAYSDYVSAYGGATPYTWTVSDGSLPDGLILSYADSDAELTGTPTKAGSYTFTLTAEDKNGVTASKAFTVTIKAESLQSAAENMTDDLNAESKTESKTESENASETHTHFVTELQVVSDDLLSQGTGRDSDIVSVRANEPVRFIIGTWPHEVSDVRVYVDDEAVEGIEIIEGMFTLPAELVHDDFKICVKAEAGDSELESELESEELYVSAE